jgi:hypothetical protein
MVVLKAQIQEILSINRYVRGDGWLRTGRTNLGIMSATKGKLGGRIRYAPYLEDGLHLVELGPRMLSSEHLDDQATDAPYISLFRVCYLSYNFWGHPIDGALEGRSV